MKITKECVHKPTLETVFTAIRILVNLCFEQNGGHFEHLFCIYVVCCCSSFFVLVLLLMLVFFWVIF